MENKDYDNAISIFKRMTDKYDDADSYYQLGTLFYDKGKYSNAMQAFKNALQFSQPYSELYFDIQHNIGLCNYEMKHYDEAIERFKAVLAIKDNDAESLYNLALLYIRKGDRTEASKIIKRLENLNKEFANKLNDEYRLI